MASEVPLSGRLRDTKLPTLLRFLQRNKKTGILNIHRNDLDKSIYIKNGDIVFAVSKYPEARLIYEGVHRNHDWTRLRREIPPLNMPLQITIDPLLLFQDVGLEPPSRQLIS